MHYLMLGFLLEKKAVDNPVKMSSLEKFKGGLPRGIAKGLTGAASTVLYAAAMMKAMEGMKHKGKEEKNKGLAKAIGIGGITAFGKGYAEGAIENVMTKMLKVK